MPSYDEDRRELFGLLEPSLGSRGAALLMEHLPPVRWEDLATKSDIVALKADMVALRSELNGDMVALRSELNGDMATLRAELIEKLAESQRAIQTTTIQTMFGAVIAVSGLVFAVATFAR
jgi:hypothetical protein